MTATLPSPSVFDILPPLHQLLSRLLAQSAGIPIPLADGQEGIAPAAGPVSSDPHALTYKDLQPLDIQQLAQEASRVKIRIQKARQAIMLLSDMERTVAEQTEEILDLEEHCEELRRVLRGMAAQAAERHGTDTAMASVEG